MLRVIIPFVLIPGTIAVSAVLFTNRQYALTVFIISVLAVVLFIAGFEKKRTGNRRLILVSIIVALSVVGRFIPVFKPVTALTVLAAVYLGKESGFLVGAMTAVISNFYFGQGPWTSFQMLAWGLIGYFAGVFGEKLKKSKPLLLLYGAVSGVLFSFVMDIWTVIWFNGEWAIELYGAALLSAVPHTLSYIVSNVIFLAALAKPIGEKLERIRIKYGV